MRRVYLVIAIIVAKRSNSSIKTMAFLERKVKKGVSNMK